MTQSRTRTLSTLAAGALAAGGLALLPTAPASAASTGLVISEAYFHGGSSGATYANRYYEIYNPTNDPITLAGTTLQYRSPGGSGAATAKVDLTGTLAAKDYYVIKGASNGAAGGQVPNVDLTSTINAGAGGGTLFLTTDTALANPATSANVIDKLGYGTSNSPEGSVASTSTLTTSLQRVAAGTDTDVNADDFAVAAPTPGEPKGGDNPPDPDPTEKTIAEIQGTGSVSPEAGKTVETSGVVTAVYPGSGYNGFYLQTPGADTEGASDGIFVYGSAATAANLAVGDSAAVTGKVSEYFGLTEITPAAGGVTKLTESLGEITPREIAYPTTEAAREAREGELLAPTDDFVVTGNYGTNSNADLTLATGGRTLVTPTEVEDAQTGDIAGVEADNAARRAVLTDGSGLNYFSTGKNTPLPWLSADNPVRVGAEVTLHQPVVLDWRCQLPGSDCTSAWLLQPQHPVTDEGADVATFSDTRTDAPENVGGDLRLATFNVLNYFTTTGVEANCASSYNDRAGNPITVRSCGDDGPRGAWDDVNLERQQDKIVDAINKLGADIVSLEEIENSVKFGKDRDDALANLVEALNEAAGSTRWAYVASPAAADLPSEAEQDVIRTAFIYNPDTVETVGAADVLVGSAAFDDAREPLAQAFKAAGGKDADAFGVIVNHFKSKGSGADDGTGQGNANPLRVAQANALVDFADDFQADRSISKVFLTGDFNSYSKEDPIQVLEAAGYTNLPSDQEGESTYNFGDMDGSLDHVLANEAALPDVTGRDIWNINADESLAFEYSRYNYNATDFYAADQFRASDHDPELIGIDVPAVQSPDVQLDLLLTNDFHGRINANTVKWAGTVEQLRKQAGEAGSAKTLFIGAGDLIGASEFASSIDQDQPTIEVLNELGLDASAVGNHEFDKGWADLRDRVIGPEDDRNAQWDYLGANVYDKETGEPVLPEYATYDVDGITVGVIGAVTEETASLVSPGGIEDLTFGPAVEAVNRVAGELTDGDADNGEADVLVASFHAGATQGVGSNYAAEVAKGGEFADMADLDPAVDVIFNGHTHQVYSWDAPVPGETGTTRPIIQTGSYGDNVGDVRLTVDRASKEVTAYTARNVARTTTADADLVTAFPRVAQVKSTVDAALAHAAEVGNTPVGSITGDVTTAHTGGSYVDGTFTGGTRDDRASESTLGDLVANALREGLPADAGTADLGVVNPGGLRNELYFKGDTAGNPKNTDGVVTYKEANDVLPFVNNIWTIKLTGAQLKSVLEQQWQPTGASRPYLQLGLSDNVRVTADPTRASGSRITSVRIDGDLIDPAATYTVSTFSFLGTGGDNFTAFTQGQAKDTGLVDRDLWIDYLQDNPGLGPDFARQQVEAPGLPTGTVVAGDEVSFTLNKLNLTSQGAPANTRVTVAVVNANRQRNIGSYDVTNGSATISFTVPDDYAGRGRVSVVAVPSGTLVGPAGKAAISTTSATGEQQVYGTPGAIDVTVDPAATGAVEVREGDEVVASGTVTGGSGVVKVGGTALDPGSHALTVVYAGSETVATSQTALTYSVRKAKASVGVEVEPAEVTVVNGKAEADVTVRAAGVTPTGYVGIFVDGSLVRAGLLEDGAATLVVGPFTAVGRQSFQVRYLGDDYVNSAGNASGRVSVVKQTPTLTTTVRPRVIRKGVTEPVVTVELTTAGYRSGGTVTLTSAGKTYEGTVRYGQVSVTLDPYPTKGDKSVRVVYSGDNRTARATDTARLTVVP